jgi:hypothetical protein
VGQLPILFEGFLHAERFDMVLFSYRETNLVVQDFAEGRIDVMPSTSLIMAVHTLPKEAGMVFSMAKPKLAVYSHMVFLSSATVPVPTRDDLIAETRLSYRGPLEVGEDLMSFEIGDTVTVHHFKP